MRGPCACEGVRSPRGAPPARRSGAGSASALTRPSCDGRPARRGGCHVWRMSRGERHVWRMSRGERHVWCATRDLLGEVGDVLARLGLVAVDAPHPALREALPRVVRVARGECRAW
eukprot:2998040-Prymnesium_polylepis.1